MGGEQKRNGKGEGKKEEIVAIFIQTFRGGYINRRLNMPEIPI
jgi:hypothetical protein